MLKFVSNLIAYWWYEDGVIRKINRFFILEESSERQEKYSCMCQRPY